MSLCACATLPSYTRVSRRITITVPAGTIATVQPSPDLIAALMLPTMAAACEAAGRFGLTPPVVTPLWEAMANRSEAEAVRVVALRDLQRTCAVKGIDWAAVTNLSMHEEVGLLMPNPTPIVRRFRNCWRRTGAVPPAVDMPLARAQRMNEVRAERSPKLEKADRDRRVAIDQGDLVLEAKLKDYAQKLRDLPATEQPNVDASTTPEQLDAWRPTWPVDPAA